MQILLLPPRGQNQNKASGFQKLINVMKLTCIFLTAFFLHAAARTSAQQLSLDVRGERLENVLRLVRQQTGFTFLAKSNLLDRSNPVTVHLVHVSLKEALDACFAGQPFSYSIEGKIITIEVRKTSVNTSPQAPVPPIIDIHGRVVNESGNPVEGVSVKVKGSAMGTTTNDKGEFTLSGVDANATLVLSSVNMETYETKLNGRRDLTLVMKVKVSKLEDVEITAVNTGYQKISKERFVGSFAQLDSQAFHDRPGMSIIDRLDGRVTGILFDRKDASDLGIRIRGISTLGSAINNGTAASPLIVIDNFPMPPNFLIDNVNVNDVENVTVLKDAAAASIWGSRAGNGVIVITTKKGRYNQRFQVEAKSEISIQEKPNQFYVPRISTSDFIDIEQYLFGKGFYDGLLNNTTNRPVVSGVVEILSRKRAGLISAVDADLQINALRGIDLRDEADNYVYRPAVSQRHYLGFNGGKDNIAYQASIGYNHSLNNVKGSQPDDQLTINTNTSFRAFKNLELKAGVSISMSNTRNSPVPTLNYSPYQQLRDASGNAVAVPFGLRLGYVDTAIRFLDGHYRPLDEITLSNNRSFANALRLNISIGYRIASWLKADIDYQYQSVSSGSRNYYSPETYAARSLINRYTNFSQTDPLLRYPIPVGGYMDANTGLTKAYNLRGSLHADRATGAHQFSVMTAAEVSDTKGGFSISQR